jgi:hypothetical protein
MQICFSRRSPEVPSRRLVGALSKFEAFAAQTAFALGGPFGGVARGLGRRRAWTN